MNLRSAHALPKKRSPEKNQTTLIQTSTKESEFITVHLRLNTVKSGTIIDVTITFIRKTLVFYRVLGICKKFITGLYLYSIATGNGA